MRAAWLERQLTGRPPTITIMSITRRERTARLAARREALVALAQLQREVIALRWRRLTPALHWIERSRHAWRLVRSHPWALLVPVGALAWLRPRWAARATAALLAVWRVERWLR